MIISRLTAKFLNLLYGPLAGVYDPISRVVSFGQWQRWIQTVIPFIAGETIVELGFGPGHLIGALKLRGFRVFGVDHSRRMARLAAGRLRKNQASFDRQNNDSLIRGDALCLPFPSSSADTVIATFPTPYVFDRRTLESVKRVLKPGGVFLVLLASQPRRDSLPGCVLSILYRVTGETPAQRAGIEEYIQIAYRASGLEPEIAWIAANYADLLLIKTVNSAFPG